MDVAFINPFIWGREYGGAEKRFYKIACYLAKRGHEVTYYTLNSLPDGHFIRYPFKVITITSKREKYPNNFIKYVNYTVGLHKYIQDHELYIFHQIPYVNFLTLIKASGIYKKGSVVFCLHDFQDTNWRKYKGRLSYQLARFVEKTALIQNYKRLWYECVSPYVFTKLYALRLYYRKPVDKLYVLENGVDFSLIANREVRGRSRNRFVYVGRLYEYKGIDRLLSICKALRKNRNIELYIVGSGERKYENLLNKLSQKCSWINYFKNLDDISVFKIMKSSYIFLLLSEIEGQSIVSLEAMACGTPIVTLNYPYNYAKYYIKEANAGIVCSSLKEVLSVVGTLLDDEERWNQLSRSGIKFSEKYDWSKVLTKAEKIYEKVWQYGA